MDVTLLSSENLSTCVLVVACCVTLALWWRKQKPKDAPPGPTGLPYIGSLLSITHSIRSGTLVEYISELHKKYGKIAAVQAGVLRFIYINDGELVAELYQKEEFAIRPVKIFPFMRQLTHGIPRGIVFGNGESHKEMRRFALLSLRDLGVGKKSLDEMIQTEATILCQHLEDLADSNGVMSDLKIQMQYATANILHHIIFCYRQDYEDPKWKSLVKLMYDLFDINFLAFPNNYLPILEKIPPLNRYLSDNKSKRFLGIHSYLGDYMNSQIEEHRSTYVDGEIRDFIDLHIKYETEQKEFYTKENIFASMLDLFRAGTGTSAATLTWAVMYLVRQPDTQRQLREEIDEFVGDKQFDRKDKDKLVKTRAFINEVHRYASIAPFVPPHTIERSVKVEGYTLAPNDIIMASALSIHHDKDYWGDPDTFRIGRWINEKGELIKHEGHFYPFSVGKRACPGKQFATIEVMLILVQFIQNFTFEQPEGYADMSDKVKSGFARAPQSFHFKVLKR